MTAGRPMNPWKLSAYKPGNLVVCKVIKPEMDGYSVIIPKDNLPGFLTNAKNLKENQEVLAEFVCVLESRLLLFSREPGFNQMASGMSAVEPVDQEQLSAYSRGQLVICTVINPEPGGYAVVVRKDKFPGFLSTRARLKVNEAILAEVVSTQGRLLLSVCEDVSDRMQWTSEAAGEPQNPWGF